MEQRRFVSLVAVTLLVACAAAVFLLGFSYRTVLLAGGLLLLAAAALGVALTLRERAASSARTLGRRDAVLGAISFAAESFLRSGNWRDGIEEALHRLGVAAEVCRVLVFENYEREDAEPAARLVFEWCDPGAGECGPSLKALAYRTAGLERWIELLGHGEAIASVVRNLPESEREILAGDGIRSFAAVPVFVGGEWWGFLGFCDCRSEQEWNSLEIGVLNAAASILGAAILRRRAEKTLVAVCRQEVSETLAGGVAHDFNNLMTGVLGGADILRVDLRSNPSAVEILNMISESAQQAGELAQLMLAFARGGKYQPKRMCLNDTVRELARRQDVAAPASIRTVRDLEPALYETCADSAQMSQMLTNLWQNAREAIEERSKETGEAGGEIVLRTANVELDEHFARRHPGARPGPCVCLTVEDDGCGIAPENLGRVFEPFFSTKFTGRGLGLSAIYGIVKNHGGYISAASSGRGAAFEVYLPAAASAAHRDALDGRPLLEDATVLVADDDELVLQVTRQLLKQLGHRPLIARDGREAVRIAREFDGEIHLTILDLAMPVMSGVEAFPLLREARPEMAVVLCSGFEIDPRAQALLDAGADGFLSKPFQMLNLAEVLREHLPEPALAGA